MIRANHKANKKSDSTTCFSSFSPVCTVVFGSRPLTSAATWPSATTHHHHFHTRPLCVVAVQLPPQHTAVSPQAPIATGRRAHHLLLLLLLLLVLQPTLPLQLLARALLLLLLLLRTLLLLRRQWQQARS